ncbi:hypothetical protein RE6C_01336 [Rhodopirellula europaea 6C]|uniref:Uncharacterized protein n=1 Tax=Rhodopirellula europaea 6C TaxID=1263867 RepID=M2B6U5_9BACT|nr:hypothetical protein RE6C_01336 [Rhodopirellula europaea 6C]
MSSAYEKRQGGRMSSLAASGFNKSAIFFERPESQSSSLHRRSKTTLERAKIARNHERFDC